VSAPRGLDHGADEVTEAGTLLLHHLARHAADASAWSVSSFTLPDQRDHDLRLDGDARLSQLAAASKIARAASR